MTARDITSADRAAWAALVVEAGLQLDRPWRDSKELRRCARECWRAVLPAGPLTRDNALAKLRDLAERFGAYSATERLVHVPELGDLHAGALHLLGSTSSEGEPPAGRYRADIDG